MSRGLTIRDLLFWARIEKSYARDDRIVAIWEAVIRKIGECVKTYYGKEARHEPRRHDDARDE